MAHYTSSLIRKYASPVPRYTSYPTAPHFSAAIGRAEYQSWLENIKPGSPVSLYVHIPYCDRLCWFCGCHTKQTRKYAPVLDYLKVLHKEIALIGDVIGEHAVVAQLHLGGGSPSMLKPGDLLELGAVLRKNFKFSDQAEISIELDPSDVEAESFGALSEFGMTRASIGVQDFAEDVQRAINRPQSFEDTRAVVLGLRKIGINSLNIDALYGLPLQNQSGLQKTLEQVLSLEPDRIAMFGYAHVPWMKKHQTMIPESTLPGLDERFAQARLAEEILLGHGLEQIGIDHFAKAGDGLALANRDKTMCRNFQGYTTDNSQYLVGLGASSIGRTPQGFIQNTHATAEYMSQVERGEIPISKGLKLSDEDVLRGQVIERLMCYFRIEFDWLESTFGDRAEPIMHQARQLVADNSDGYFVETAQGFHITDEGKPFVRQFAAWFDAYLGQGTARHSIAV